MKRQLQFVVAAVTLLCASLAWSQSTSSSSSGSSQTLFTNSAPGAWTDSGQNDSGQNGSSDTSQNGTSDSSQNGVNGPQDTFGHPETLPPLNLFGDVTSHTGLSISTAVGTLAERVSGEGVSEWQNLSTFSGAIGLSQVRPTLAWGASYSGGINLTTGISNYNYTTLNQGANGRVTWNFAKRWQLKLKDDYFYSDDPFQPFLTYVGQPTPNNPNPVIYLPQAIVEQNQGHADILYQLSSHDILDFSGGESFQRYLRASYYSLWNSVTYSGAAFYQHQASARLSMGGGYQFAALDFGHGQSRAGVSTLEYFISYIFSPHVQGSVWVGPQYTTNKDIVPVFCSPYGCFVTTQHTQQWNVAEGGNFRYQRSTGDAFGVNFSHGVSDGGGILGASSIYQITATYGRPLNRLWNLGAGVNWSDSNSISEFYSGPQYLKSVTGTVGVTRQIISEAWFLNIYYAFIHQSQNYVGFPGVYSTSGVGFTIRYSWNRGLGR